MIGMRRLLAFGSFSLFIAAVAACSAGAEDDDTGTGASGTTNGPGASASSSNVGGGFGTGGNDNPSAGCSSDLQKTVDEMGNILAVCPPDKGCQDGACVPACQAAAASKGSIGCEYFAPTPPFYVNESTSPRGVPG